MWNVVALPAKRTVQQWIRLKVQTLNDARPHNCVVVRPRAKPSSHPQTTRSESHSAGKVLSSFVQSARELNLTHTHTHKNSQLTHIYNHLMTHTSGWIKHHAASCRTSWSRKRSGFGEVCHYAIVLHSVKRDCTMDKSGRPDWMERGRRW